MVFLEMLKVILNTEKMTSKNSPFLSENYFLTGGKVKLSVISLHESGNFLLDEWKHYSRKN